MRSGSKTFGVRAGWSLLALAALFTLVSMAWMSVPALAQNVEPQVIAAQKMVTIEPATLRTEQQMAEAEAAMQAAGPTPSEVPFRPTAGSAAYQASKASAVAAMDGKPAMGETAVAPMGSPTFKGISFSGATSTGWHPPDTHGAIGRTHFVEVTNTAIDIYTRRKTLARHLSLNAFAGYTAKTLFDPRCIYDSTWNRWIVTAPAFPEDPDPSTGTQYQRFMIAISQTPNPTGAFWIYWMTFDVTGDFFWDYPMVGMDQDSIIFTANWFGPTSYIDTRMFAIPKARLYNGLGASFPFYTGLFGTLAPPMVLDDSGDTYLVAAPGYGCDAPGTLIVKYRLQNSSRPWDQVLTASTITVPAYCIPPNAAQPGTTDVLDTLDARFQNIGAQITNWTSPKTISQFQIHAVNLAGYAGLKWYELDVLNDTVLASGNIYASPTSYDFNPSIAANASKDVFITYSSTDPRKSLNAQVRYTGKLGADAAIGAGNVLLTSPTNLIANPDAGGVARWGDYSAVTVDPLNQKQGWLVNEKILTTDYWNWGSQIGRIGF